MSHLTLDNLEKRYGSTTAVAALSLGVAKGELLGLLGPSGCGKTTTLRMIAGLVPATAGRITVAGADVTALPPHRRDMGVVFQSYALFPHMNVADNIAFGLRMRPIPKAEIAARVAAALDLVRLPHLAARRPKELSGGQQQRVALARALVIEPSILLLDEPLSNLDAKLREDMRTEIRDIQQRLGITTIFVTHDQAEALAMCDRIAVMHAGRLEQLGTPEAIYEHPASQFVADFVGRTNRIDATSDGTRLTAGALAFRAPPGPAGAVTAMIRPHRIRLAPPPDETWNSAPARLIRRTYIGETIACTLACGDITLTAEYPTQPDLPPPGEDLTLSWRIADTMVFPR
jgi:putative spermidine/putrescine transport system ATP-binding protein